MRVMPGGALEAEDTTASAASTTTTTTTTAAASSLTSSSSSLFVGRKLQDHRGAFILEHPMEQGQIQGWDAMEALWEVRSRIEQTLSCLQFANGQKLPVEKYFWNHG